jgi:ABC-type uncharacterized transport system fused permease/ATPase subunit
MLITIFTTILALTWVVALVATSWKRSTCSTAIRGRLTSHAVESTFSDNGVYTTPSSGSKSKEGNRDVREAALIQQPDIKPIRIIVAVRLRHLHNAFELTEMPFR